MPFQIFIQYYPSSIAMQRDEIALNSIMIFKLLIGLVFSKKPTLVMLKLEYSQIATLNTCQPSRKADNSLERRTLI
jgi:hypothetical protein